MKEFSKKWISSKKPKKQRKYSAKAPIHIKRKMLSVNLSKELRKKYNRRNIEVRKGDTVKILVGKNKNKEGKVSKILTKKLKVYIEKVQAKKQDGSMVDIPLRPSNLQIIGLNTDDKKRFRKLKTANSKNKNEPEVTKEEPKNKEKIQNKKENKENKKWEGIWKDNLYQRIGQFRGKERLLLLKTPQKEFPS